MKKAATIAILAAFLMAVPVQSTQAHSYDRDDDGHLLRLFAHIVHPIGIALEYGVFRPIHTFISRTKNTQIWFGHDAREGEDYNTWK